MSLRRIDEAQNLFRFYALDIEQDLFGKTLLARRWGRIGTYGRARFDEYPDEGAAQVALAAMALAKQRRGYRNGISCLHAPTNQRGDQHGHTFETAPIDETSEPPLPF
jgi:predicted DNA-binding WGR domain protein